MSHALRVPGPPRDEREEDFRNLADRMDQARSDELQRRKARAAANIAALMTTLQPTPREPELRVTYREPDPGTHRFGGHYITDGEHDVAGPWLQATEATQALGLFAQARRARGA